jgi:dTMP kinase
LSLFITFEGGEGCGKSTQARALYRRLHGLAVPTLLTHEPGGTPLGKSISYFLKWKRDAGVSPLAELLLFNASRANLVDSVIRPALNEGKIVLCDRFTDSTMAYQGYGRGLSLTTVKSVCGVATQGLKPDLTILLDMPVEDGLARKAVMHPTGDRFEQTEVAFHERVRKGYLTLAGEEPDRWFVVDARQSKERVKETIWKKVREKLSAVSNRPSVPRWAS